jgi:lipopolysaccharide/colanic/teichoic acid biosynthesis glycosyltransferase
MALLLLWPLLLLLALLIRWNMGPPALFRQQRPGLNGAPFTLLKFRTMKEANGADGQPLPDAERLTPLGAFIRRASLDELPQLINVLRGDMSLVGPRPLLMEYLPLYSARQARRHEVRPGITGWAQVNGRNALRWPEKLEMDVWYVDNRSFLLDMKILMLTVARVVSRSGISQPGAATMEKFRGEGNETRDGQG